MMMMMMAVSGSNRVRHREMVWIVLFYCLLELICYRGNHASACVFGGGGGGSGRKRTISLPVQVGTTPYTVQFSSEELPSDIARNVCGRLVPKARVPECSAAVKVEAQRQIERAHVEDALQCVAKQCGTFMHMQGSEKTLSTLDVGVAPLAFAVDRESVGVVPFHALRVCGTWRPGLTALGEAVLSMDNALDKEEKPLWVEISGAASSRDSFFLENDDVAYFAFFAAAREADVHVFEPTASKVVRILENARASSLSQHVTVHPSYVVQESSDTSSSSSAAVTKQCTDKKICGAILSTATFTTIDRALFAQLYRQHGRKRVRWLHVRQTSVKGMHATMRGMRKMLALGWIDTVVVDRRRVSASRRWRSLSASDVVRDAFLNTDYVHICLDNTTMGDDVATLDAYAMSDIKRVSSFASCELLVAFRDANVFERVLRRTIALSANVSRVRSSAETTSYINNRSQSDQGKISPSMMLKHRKECAIELDTKRSGDVNEETLLSSGECANAGESKFKLVIEKNTSALEILQRDSPQ